MLACTNRVGLFVVDSDPGSIMPNEPKAEVVSIVGSGLDSNLGSMLGSDLTSSLLADADTVLGSIVRSNPVRR